MSYLRFCWSRLAVFGSSVWIFRVMPSGLSSDWRMVAIVWLSEKPVGTRIVVLNPCGTEDLAISALAAGRLYCSPLVAGWWEGTCGRQVQLARLPLPDTRGR